MKRRHYLIIIIILFGLSMWGLVTTLNDSLEKNRQVTQIPNANEPEVPAPVQVLTPVAEPDVVLDNLVEGQKIVSPFTLTGKAKGTWFFEGSFPIEVTTNEGKVIAVGIAQSKDDWMTTEYVRFSANINFIVPAGTTGAYLVLKKDNPSGEARFDKSLPIKVQW